VVELTTIEEQLCTESHWDFSDLRALYINCTLKRSPEGSNIQGLADRSIAIMERNGVSVETIRAVDHEIATGVYPDMTDRGWERDEWPAISERVMASDILVLLSPIWLGEKSSVCTRVIERLYGSSHLLNDAGQYAYYGRLHHHRQRGRCQALRDEHPLLASAPRIHDPAAGRLGVAR
jgi:multimeric flavodoxin WrbA